MRVVRISIVKAEILKAERNGVQAMLVMAWCRGKNIDSNGGMERN